MKNNFYIVVIAAATICLSSCNTETGTVHNTPEGYGAGQREPDDMGDGGPTRDSDGRSVQSSGTTSGQFGTSDTGEPDTTGTSATTKTKTGAGSSQTRGTTNTSQSETTKNVEVTR